MWGRIAPDERLLAGQRPCVRLGWRLAPIKPQAVRPDLTPMAEFSIESWMALGAVMAVATLAFLHTLAAAARNEIAAHDLRVRVARLRIEYYRRIQEDGGAPLPGGVIEVGPADELEEPRLAA